MRIITKLLLALTLAVSSAATADELGLPSLRPGDLYNGRVSAKFDNKGISSITAYWGSADITFDRTISFKNDTTLVVFDDHSFDTGSMKPESIEKSKESVTYNYKWEDVTARIVYELKPGWGFVSKQLFLTHEGHNPMHVKKVEMIKPQIVDPIAYDHYIDKGWKGVWAGMTRFVGSDVSGIDYGMFFLVQNPFMKWSRYYQNINVSYEPDIDWKSEWGTFTSDRACFGIYPLSGRMFPGKPMPEDKFFVDPEKPVEWAQKVDYAEINALQDCVREFMMNHPKKSIRLNVGWCENDYQIDLATPQGRTEYKRIIDRASELGVDNILLGAANSEISDVKECRDAWGWENVLWLGLGQKIRKGEWDPAKDKIPASLQEILDYAKSRKVKLVAYVYPTIPFMQDPQWTAWAKGNLGGYRGVDIGERGFQDWFIKKLVDFHKKTGISGYSFDHWYLNGGTSTYTQWMGMKRVLEALQRQIPGIILDGRQAHHAYGPWTSLSGCYPHPFGFDEQPGSFGATADLHTDRLSANHVRAMNYIFRMQSFFPLELTPGYMTHQTQRSDAEGKMHRDTFRTRDWDYLGWKYSVISSIATAPYIHTVSLIPARDESEFKAFSDEDKKWFRKWLDFTDQNIEILKHIQPIIGPPGVGRVDGTAAFHDGKGYIFLFNPNYKKMDVQFKLDTLPGMRLHENNMMITQIFPREGVRVGGPSGGYWQGKDTFQLTMDGASAVVLEVNQTPTLQNPILFNATGNAQLTGDKLSLTSAKGEIGTIVELVTLLPEGKKINSATVNGKNVTFIQDGDTVKTKVTFVGQPFGKCQQVSQTRHYPPGGMAYKGDFTIPARIFAQLAARKKAWPIPYTEDDLLATWVAPHRLLMLINIAGADPKTEVSLRINDQPVEVKKAWNGIYSNVGPGTFIGNYVDLSNLTPDTKYTYELTMPPIEHGQFQGLFFDNIEPEFTEEISL